MKTEYVTLDTRAFREAVKNSGRSAASLSFSIGKSRLYLTNLFNQNPEKCRMPITCYSQICDSIGIINGADYIWNEKSVSTCFGKKIDMDASEKDKADILEKKIVRKDPPENFMNKPIIEKTREQWEGKPFGERMAIIEEAEKHEDGYFDYEPPRVVTGGDLNYKKAWAELKKWAVSEFMDDDTTDIPVVSLLDKIKEIEYR